MTTAYSNTAGNLDKKIILSFPYDPERPDANEQLLVTSPGKSMLPSGDAESLFAYSEGLIRIIGKILLVTLYERLH